MTILRQLEPERGHDLAPGPPRGLAGEGSATPETRSLVDPGARVTWSSVMPGSLPCRRQARLLRTLDSLWCMRTLAARPGRWVTRVGTVLAVVLAITVVVADASLAGRNLAFLAAAAFLAPAVGRYVYRQLRAGHVVTWVVVLVVTVLGCLYLRTGDTLAQAIVEVPYHSDAVIKHGRLVLREQIVLDHSVLDPLNEAINETRGAPKVELRASDAIMSAGWVMVDTRNGSPVYEHTRTLRVASPWTMATVHVPVGISWVDGLGQLRFPVARDVWTMRPAPGSMIDIRAPRGTIEATSPPFISRADVLDTAQDDATVPLNGVYQVSVALFGPLLNNALGRAAYRAYQQNLALWVVGVVFFALGAVLTEKLKKAIDRLLGWTVRAVKAAPKAQAVPAEEQSARIEVAGAARRVRTRPTQPHFHDCPDESRHVGRGTAADGIPSGETPSA